MSIGKQIQAFLKVSEIFLRHPAGEVTSDAWPHAECGKRGERGECGAGGARRPDAGESFGPTTLALSGGTVPMIDGFI